MKKSIYWKSEGRKIYRDEKSQGLQMISFVEIFANTK